ncbi:unnamed protein product [Didymodactylos carnosus]|uniref:Uncharacterized protein n=1 Tax=Didymodactylos carnosus TaxID=1234261 RepID=A0A815XCS6_9BILA|nr:unnamed protein product [Didymodactylos carnosus]CAF4416909.1 unnamed protein product [Didymodactylos carnosus]
MARSYSVKSQNIWKSIEIITVNGFNLNQSVSSNLLIKINEQFPNLKCLKFHLNLHFEENNNDIVLKSSTLRTVRTIELYRIQQQQPNIKLLPQFLPNLCTLNIDYFSLCKITKLFSTYEYENRFLRDQINELNIDFESHFYSLNDIDLLFIYFYKIKIITFLFKFKVTIFSASSIVYEILLQLLKTTTTTTPLAYLKIHFWLNTITDDDIDCFKNKLILYFNNDEKMFNIHYDQSSLEYWT